MKLFDCNICIGSPTRGLTEPGCSSTDVLSMMAENGIEKSLVWHIAQHDCSAQAGNTLISEVIAEEPNLLGCWSILPPQTDEVIGDGFFDQMKANGITALRAMPIRHYYMLNRVVFGGFLDEVSARKIPLVVSLAYGSDWSTIYGLLSDYPELTCIICDTGVWSQNRYIFPIINSYPNVLIETSMQSIGAGCLETGVKKYGAHRFVFGSGYPARCAVAAAMDVLHSSYSDDDRDAIAYGNMHRLIDGVRW